MAVILAIPGSVTLVTELFQIGKAVIARGQLELRQVVLAKGKLQIAHLRDLGRVLQSSLVGPKELFHLRLTAEIEVLGLIAHPISILQQFTGLDTQQNIVGLGVLLAEIVGVIGADQRKTCFLVHS